MKNRVPIISTWQIGAGLLAMATFISLGSQSLVAQTSTDSAHAAHVAAGATAPDTASGDPALSQQLSQLQSKVAQLEAVLAKNAPPMTAPEAAAPMPGMPTAARPAPPAMNMGMDKMKPGGGMPGMSAPAAPAAGMMGMMDKMMGMMDKMMSSGGGSMPGGMGMDKMEMGGDSMSGGAPAGGMGGSMSGGGMGARGMGMEKMEMAKMMGMGTMSSSATSTMRQSALPGFPGASHLYHIGATDFFLDHPHHIALSTEQKAALNKAKELALLAKSTSDRAIQQTEQELWTLTSADQPESAQIEAKVAEIEKHRGDARLRFISAVGDAAKILTDQQRKILTGFAPPVPAAQMGGMEGM